MASAWVRLAYAAVSSACWRSSRPRACSSRAWPYLGQRKVAEELAVDKELYRSHQDCRTLVCFVYDPGYHLDDPTALENDLTNLADPMPTLVIVAPLA